MSPRAEDILKGFQVNWMNWMNREDLVAGQRRPLNSGRGTRGQSSKEDPEVQSCLQRDQLFVGRTHGKVPIGEKMFKYVFTTLVYFSLHFFFIIWSFIDAPRG
jgi:hypothetical protein